MKALLFRRRFLSLLRVSVTTLESARLAPVPHSSPATLGSFPRARALEQSGWLYRAEEGSMAIVARIRGGVVDHFPARVSEWIVACILVSWGYILLKPSNIFATSPAFSEMAKMAPEWVWGTAAIAIGLSRLAALVINGTFPRTWYGKWSPKVRGLMSALSMFILVSISLGIAKNGADTTALAVYPWLAALDFWNVFRAFKDAGHMTEARRNGAT